MTINILAVFSSPGGMTKLNVGDEAHVLNKLNLDNEPFSVIPKENITKAEFEEYLRVKKERKPINIIHFSGHSDEYFLYFGKEKNKYKDPMEVEVFIDLIREHVGDNPKLCLVILNSCESHETGRTISNELNVSTISMSDEITDEAAIIFTRNFYDRLSTSNSIQDAYKSACNHVRIHHPNEWEIPRINGNRDKIFGGSVFMKYLLGWSDDWKSTHDEILKRIGIQDKESLFSFVSNQEQWNDAIKTLKEELEGTLWFENSFNSIKVCAKGLRDARYLDHAFISVPPPRELLTNVHDNLKMNKLYGLIAPSGWGKSRFVLWIALLFYLEDNDIFYFADPIPIHQETIQKELKSLLEYNNILLIFDDFHRYGHEDKQDYYWNELKFKVGQNNNKILLIQTQSSQEPEKDSFPLEIPYLSSKKYQEYWMSTWKQQFISWFSSLSQISRLDLCEFDLYHAQKTTNPWAFVSVLVNLKKIIKDHFTHEGNPFKIILFTLIVWGYAISRETGITPNELFNGLRWLYENKSEMWNALIRTGSKFWDAIEDNNREKFSEMLETYVTEWQSQPHGYSEIRILPYESSYGRNVPISPHHSLWWTNALNSLWDEHFSKDTVLCDIKSVCQLILIKTCSIIDCNWLELEVEELEHVFTGCTGLKELYLDIIKVFYHFPDLESCKKLEILDLRFNGISEIKGLENLVNLKGLYLTFNMISEIKGLENLEKLERLDLRLNMISEIKGLEKLVNLKTLRLSNNKISKIKGLENLEKLENIDLSSNRISEIKGLENLDNLKYLNLENNNLNYEEQKIILQKTTKDIVEYCKKQNSLRILFG